MQLANQLLYDGQDWAAIQYMVKWFGGGLAYFRNLAKLTSFIKNANRWRQVRSNIVRQHEEGRQTNRRYACALKVL